MLLCKCCCSVYSKNWQQQASPTSAGLQLSSVSFVFFSLQSEVYSNRKGLLAEHWPTCVSRQLSRDPHVALAGLQAVYGADVVQASTGHIVPRRSVGTRHHPGGAQWDGMHLRDTMSREVKRHSQTRRRRGFGVGLPSCQALHIRLLINSQELCCFDVHQ